MFGVTETGFVPKGLAECKTEIEADLRAVFGDDIDLRAESNFGQLAGIWAAKHAETWALAQDTHLAQYPASASGVNLDYAAAITNTFRKLASPTVATLTLYGTDGTLVPAGSLFKDTVTNKSYSNGLDITLSKGDAVYAEVQVATLAAGAYTVTINGLPYTFTAGGSDTKGDVIAGLAAAITGGATPIADGETLKLSSTTSFAVAVTGNLSVALVGTQGTITGTEAGAYALPAGGVTEIVTPTSGLERVTNLTAGITGDDRETDEELRIRQRESVDISIIRDILAVDGVLQARVFENNTAATDGDGTPAHHIWAIVLGGDDTAIAQAIVDNNAAGVGMRGTTAVSLTHPSTGEPTDVRFERPAVLAPTITVTYTALTGFPLDGEAQMNQALVEYSESLNINDPLIYSRLFCPLNSVTGVQIDSLQVNGGTANVVAAKNEIIRINASDVTITETP